ncbi:outer membrane protein assembly factor BamE [Celerinatantimonas yamalensis]|uniref:Outer membrane protein assembly factor BamE n=1 Tax=Celerinatantimonas yamalensis TaxID=559956 RepID=A0ABW9G410_9GAMM
MKIMRTRLIISALLATSVLSGCSQLNKLVYKIDIPQGNFVEQKDVNQLHVGMSPAQVKYLMGTPMLVDAFTPNQWYYIYRYQVGNGKLTQKKLIATFKNNKLQSIRGDYPIGPSFNIPVNAPVQATTS